MVTRKEELVSVEQNHVPACVSGHWNDCHIVIEPMLGLTFQDALDVESGGAVGCMHHPLGAEFPGERRMIGDVVAVCQKNRPNAAEALDLLHQRTTKARRIHK